MFSNERLRDMLNVSADGVLGFARVIGRNDNENIGRVRIYPIHRMTKDWKYLESKEHEGIAFAEVISPLKGENHGVYYTPEFGDFVVYTTINGKRYILGSINYPGKAAADLMPVEAQSMQKNSVEYNPTHWPDLTSKGYHSPEPEVGSKYQPASFLQRWRKNDILMLSATKIEEQPNSAIKLMEIRSSENQFIQMVDLGNYNIKPGLSGTNAKSYSPMRQNDYRDLWEGFPINKEYWTNRSSAAPLANESQFLKIATNGNDLAEIPNPDSGKDLPSLTRGETRTDDRMTDGSFETSKTYCPVYQTLKTAKGPERYFQDKPGGSPYAAGSAYRTKLIKWIEDTGDPYDPLAQKLNIGHYLTMSNTIFKRRVVLSSKKGHQLTFSDIDNDEKVILNSKNGKFLYMEDSSPNTYDVLWMASKNHHFIMCDNQNAPFLVDDQGRERHKLVDPNQKNGSAFQLLQSGGEQKIWLSDSSLCPRVHIESSTGHEILLLDHDQGVIGSSPTPGKGKIQFTTNDKQMQITMDVENGDIVIQNHNLGGKGKTGDVSIYAANNIVLNADNQILMRANLGYSIQSTDGDFNVDACSINHNCDSNDIESSPEQIRKSVLSKIETTEGSLINKFSPN